MKCLFFIIGAVCLFASATFGAEVKNLSSFQDGDVVVVEYDLLTDSSENTADVTVILEIGGKSYFAESLSIWGDYGKNVKLGKKKRFYWSGLKNFPIGYTGEITWDVSAPRSVAMLRSVPKILSEEDVRDLIKTHGFFCEENDWSKKWANPSGDFENDFVDNGDGTVMDRITGLMWQKSGSNDSIPYSEAKEYIDRLNRDRFAGYNDWRLPTLPELASLLESKALNGDLYIDPIFDKYQLCCWTGDQQRSSDSECYVSFNYGNVNWRYFDYNFVRAVRRRQ